MDEALIQSVAEAIEAADVGYNLRLTKLLDGISEYTLTYADGEEHVFEDINDGYRHIRDRRFRAKAVAAIGAVNADRQARFEILQAAYRRGVDFAAEHLNLDGDEYADLWEYVPKAAYDYADKTTSPEPVTPPKQGS